MSFSNKAMLDIGLDVAKSFSVNSLEEAQSHLDELGDFPIILRPAYTLGGTGGGIAYNREEFDQMMVKGLEASPISQVLMEECLLGWKEYEMEVMRAITRISAWSSVPLKILILWVCIPVIPSPSPQR